MQDDIRLAGLQAVCAKLGGPSTAARALGYNTPSFFSQMLHGARPITEKTAIRIESRLGLPNGWLRSPQATLEDLNRRERASGRTGWFGNQPATRADSPNPSDQALAETGTRAGEESATWSSEADADLPLQGMTLCSQRRRALGIRLPASAMFQVAGAVTRLLEEKRRAPEILVVDTLITLARDLSREQTS